MLRFTIGLIGRGQNQHVECFVDFATALAASLRTLGHEVVSEQNPGRLILFGANNMTDDAGVLPSDAIIFNTEQVAIVGGRAFMQSHAQYGRRGQIVWDYSEANIQKLRALGIERTVHCPIGYDLNMVKIPKAAPEEEDIDVLHYGSMNTKRQIIIDALRAAGLRVEHLFGVYGESRDAMIRRAKVVLNLHFYEGAVFEIFRCSHLFANAKCVVTEDGGCDPELENFAQRAAVYVRRDQIVDACRMLVADRSLRQKHAGAGYSVFSEKHLFQNVRDALAQSEPLREVRSAV